MSATATRSLSGLDDRDIAGMLAHASRWVGALRGARVLVTGATGWFGTWLLDALVALDREQALGLRVVAVSRDPQRFASRHRLLAAAPVIEWIAGDVRDAALVVPGALTHVIHAATESSTTLTVQSATTMADTIVGGTRNVFDLARRAGARRFLFVSSGAVYGNGPFDEEAHDPSSRSNDGDAYGDGKSEAEALLLAAGAPTLDVVIARCFAFVGPHMPLDAHFAIGNFIRDAGHAREIVIEGDGTPRRSYQYMSDLVVWLLTILVSGRARGVYNVGGEEVVSIAALAGRCAQQAGGGVRIEHRSTGGRDYVPELTRARVELGLTNDVSLDDAIARTLAWSRRVDRSVHATARSAVVRIPESVAERAIGSVGRFFEPISGIDRVTLGRDHVNPERYRKNIEALDREVPLAGKRLLEIGCGFGVSLAVMLKSFDVDAWGIEPASEGFDSSFACAHDVLEANGLARERVVDAVGERIPFDDGSFDVVYSNNVLEHTSDPARVLEEALRVLKPGGTLFVEVPNYLAYFEGHYFVPQPPILWNGLLAFWMGRVMRRDPAFARTLRTEINPVWLRRTLRRIGRVHPLQLHTLGEERFLKRMSRPFVFQTDAARGQTGRAIRLLQRLNAFNWVGRLLVRLQAHYPIVLVATRLPGRRGEAIA